MNNEPVAWILADKENEYIRSVMIVKHDIVPKDCIEIPLYTHPAKTLTDEEILTTIKEFQEEQNPPYKEYENTYMDGWTDACNEIYSAVFELLKG